MAAIEKKGKGKIEVNWCYVQGDNDLKSCGEEYKDLLKIKFNFCEEEDDDFDDDSY